MKSVSLKRLAVGIYLMPGDSDIINTKDEILEWCTNTFDRKNWRVDFETSGEDKDVFWYPTYSFVNDEDYMLFCMRWL